MKSGLSCNGARQSVCCITMPDTLHSDLIVDIYIFALVLRMESLQCG
jgi:hypothetical protein